MDQRFDVRHPNKKAGAVNAALSAYIDPNLPGKWGTRILGRSPPLPQPLLGLGPRRPGKTPLYWRGEVVMPRWLQSVLFAAFVIVLCSVLGGVFGPGVTGVSAASSGPEEDLKPNIKRFTKVYEVVEENFADQVTYDKGIY